MRVAARVVWTGLLVLCLSAAASDGVSGLVAELSELLRRHYVAADRLPAIEEKLRLGVDSGAYRESQDPRQLAARLMSDLRSSSRDLHFGVRVRPVRSDEGDAASGRRRPTKGMETAPVGIGTVEVLDGGVGYLEVLAFPDPELGRAAADQAFSDLASTAALIIDVRRSRGGHPAMVAYLLSHFFPGEPFVFNRFEWPGTGKELEFRTLAELPSPRYVGRDVFVLTSAHTPSAAEGFTYHLKHLGRAMVVGERTAGAAHTTQVFDLGDFQVAIPTGRPVSPVTGTNWEGTGVIPHHESPAHSARAIAHRLALEQLLERATDSEARLNLEKALRRLEPSPS